MTNPNPPDRRTCVNPGDQEHDHAMCEDVVAEGIDGGPINWRSVAARIALADGAFFKLTAPERDALEVAMDEERGEIRNPAWVFQDAARQGADLGLIYDETARVLGVDPPILPRGPQP